MNPRAHSWILTIALTISATWAPEAHAADTTVTYSDLQSPWKEQTTAGHVFKMSGAVTVGPFVTANDFHDGFAWVLKQGDKGYRLIDMRGREVTQTPFTAVGDFSTGLARVQTRFMGPWGYTNAQGDVVIAQRFQDATDFTIGGFASVRETGGKWGVIDRKGQYVLEPKYEGMGKMTGDRIPVITSLEPLSWGVVDLNGKASALPYPTPEPPKFVPPPESCPSLERYALEMLGKQGPPIDIAITRGEGDYRVLAIQQYRYGVQHITQQYYESGSEDWSLPGVTLEQGLQIVQACVPDVRFVQGKCVGLEEPHCTESSIPGGKRFEWGMVPSWSMDVTVKDEKLVISSYEGIF